MSVDQWAAGWASSQDDTVIDFQPLMIEKKRKDLFVCVLHCCTFICIAPNNIYEVISVEHRTLWPSSEMTVSAVVLTLSESRTPAVRSNYTLKPG